MRYCWSYSNDSGNMIAPGVILWGVLSLPELIGGKHPAHSITIFCFLYAIVVFFTIISARKYKVCAEGIILVYPFGIRKLYPWSEFSEIALCKIHFASGSSAHILGIRCSLSSKTSVPSNATSAREVWTTMTYEARHFRHLFSIYYTDERYEELLKFCPFPIKNYYSLKP